MSIDTSVGRVDGVRVSIDTSVQVSGQGSDQCTTVTHLCHTLKQNYRTFTHMQTLVCAWKSAWASLKPRPPGA